MRPVSEKTQAVRDLVTANPAVTFGEAKAGLIKRKLFTDSEGDESYFNNVKSQFLKRQATATPAKKVKATRPKVSRPTPASLNLADAVQVINANGGSVTAVKAKIAELTDAIGVIESNNAVLSKLAS
jgi:hypothetical protein